MVGVPWPRCYHFFQPVIDGIICGVCGQKHALLPTPNLQLMWSKLDQFSGRNMNLNTPHPLSFFFCHSQVSTTISMKNQKTTIGKKSCHPSNCSTLLSYFYFYFYFLSYGFCLFTVLILDWIKQSRSRLPIPIINIQKLINSLLPITDQFYRWTDINKSKLLIV